MGAELKPCPEVWGGQLFALLGAWVWVGWIRRDRLARNLALWAMLGGIGFPIGQCLQSFHAWNLEIFKTGPRVKHDVRVVDDCPNLLAADWELDGEVDLLVGGMIQSQHRGLKLMLHSGAGTSWSQFVIQSDGGYSAQAGDIDNDGDLDIVGILNWDSPPTYIYRNNSAGGSDTKRPTITSVTAVNATTVQALVSDRNP